MEVLWYGEGFAEENEITRGKKDGMRRHFAMLWWNAAYEDAPWQRMELWLRSRNCTQAFAPQQGRLRMESIPEITSATAVCWDQMETY